MITLTDTIALVTGAAGGIGRETVKAMIAAGATVYATDRVPDARIDGAEYLPHDVTNPDDWQRVAETIRARHGRLDALVNLAAISIVTRIEDTPLAQWHHVNAVNVDSAIIGVQTLLPLLRASGQTRSGGASIVNVSSVGGQRSAPFNAAYCVSKAALAMLSKCMGAEFAALGYNIRCNSVHPGGIDTAMLSGIMDRYVDLGAVASRDVAMAGVIANHPIGRLGRADEIGGAIVFLCSTAASFVTCSELNVDGGFAAV